MEIEFDPAKDVLNRTKHGISLEAAIRFEWDSAIEREDDRFDYGEVRIVAIGRIDQKLFVMVFVEGADEETIRVISLRPAEKHEARFYYAQIRPDDR